TNLAVVHAVCDALDELRPDKNAPSRRELITFVKDRPGHDFRYAIDFSKLHQALGWSPAESFESGILKTVRWYLDNEAWVERVKSGAYQQWIREQYNS
ncbi:MAG: GDP-mannose 4,6-dehydratase, partial [Calditrichaeota bacterium]|nr:GDP-mannose 4,6-dehydratase [Calditrichota bacterium]